MSLLSICADTQPVQPEVCQAIVRQSQGVKFVCGQRAGQRRRAGRARREVAGVDEPARLGEGRLVVRVVELLVARVRQLLEGGNQTPLAVGQSIWVQPGVQSTVYDTAGAFTPAPAWYSHSFLPLLASKARK